DRYEVLGRIGSGGTGVVYRARDCREEREVAIKVFSTALSPARATALLREEFETLCRLSHPNIVRMFALGEDRRGPFLVVELVPGDDLSQHMKAGLNWASAPERVAEIAGQICGALDYIHSRDVAHLDLKPSNVLLDRSGTVRVTDFGLAVRVSELAGAGPRAQVSGTLEYIAPEQLLGRPPDFRSDFFSLGLLLYELVTGQLPFAPEPAGVVMAENPGAHPARPHRLVSNLPPALETVMLRLLRREPEDRVQSALEVLDILRRTAPMKAPPAGAPEALQARGLVAGALVGREEEVRVLDRCLADAVRGMGQAVQISGLPGVGKTRLVRELVGLAGTRGMGRFEIRCHEAGSPPLEPVAELIRRMLGWLEQSSRETVSRHLGEQKGLLLSLVPEFIDREYMAGESVAGRLAGAAEQQALFDAVIGFLVSTSQECPLLLVFEDLRWADSATRQFLRRLADAISDAHILAVVTIRSGETPEAGEGRLPPSILHLELTPLAPEQSKALVGSLLASGQVPRVLGEWIDEKEPGNPLYLQEVVRSLAEEGRLQRRRSRWLYVGEPAHLDAVPDGAAEVIGLRSLRLRREAREVLDWAAVAGEEFRREIIEGVCSGGRAGLSEALEELEDRQLIQEEYGSGGRRYLFSHSLVREVTYDQIPVRRRRRLHVAMGDALERQAGGEVEPEADRLAYHFYLGQNWHKAATYAEAAAARATSLYCLDDGLRYLDWSLDALGRLGETDETLEGKARNWRLKGELLRRSGDFRAAAGAHEEGLNWARRAESDEEITRNLNNFGLCQWHLGAFSDALAAFTEATVVAERLGERELQGQLLNSIGLVHWSLSEFEQALAHFQRALDLALAIQDSRGQGILLANMGLVCAALGRYEEAIDLTLKGLEIWKARGDRQEEAIALGNLATFYVRLARYDEAREATLSALETRREIGDRWGEAVSIANLGQILYHLGRPEEAASHLRRAVAGLRDLGDKRSEAGNLINLANALIEMGERAKAKECVDQAMAAAAQLEDRSAQAFAHATAGRWHRLAGEIDKAVAEHRALLGLAGEIGEPSIEVEGRLELAKDFAAQGDLEASRKEAEAAARAARSMGMAHELWQALALLARVRRETREEVEAVDVFLDALMVLDRILGGLHEARDRASYAGWTGVRGVLDEAKEIGTTVRSSRARELVHAAERLLSVIQA
ncbi:hypothetical protein AMJ71_04675, partial [candidate division TA06 bacterium SM1_40]